MASEHEAVHVYPATKAALAWWARREGVKPDWIGSGIRVNAVAPGLVDTIAFLLSDQASLIVGVTWFVDGGTDAIMHPLRPQRM